MRRVRLGFDRGSKRPEAFCVFAKENGMKRFCIAAGFALLVLGLMAGCGGNQTSIQNNTGASLINISPSAAKFGGTTDFTITVTASSVNPFSPGTVVEWTGTKLVTSTIPTGTQATTVTATVPHSLIATPGTAFITTLTPQSGAGNNGISNSLTFLVYGNPNPAPTLSSMSPNSANTCTGTNCAGVNITLTGTNFLTPSTNGGSSVTYTGLATGGVETAINVSSISSTQIKAVIPGSYLLYADSAQINVLNPPSAVCLVNCPNLGGGDTNAPGNVTTQIFTIGGGASSGNSTGAATAEEETPAVSQDGRYVAYASQQSDTTQIFVRDTCLGAAQGCTPATQPVSIASDGTPANAESHTPSMSSDGRYIAFSSAATNLAEGAPAGRQIYLRDTCVGAATGCKAATSLVSVDSSGSLNGTEAILPSVSSSGRFIAFVAVTKSNAPSASATTSSTAAPAAKSATPNSGLRQVFVRDTCAGATSCTPKTTRISMQPGDESSGAPKAAGPAISGLAGQIALPDGKSSTFFTQNRPVDDRVFLAATGDSASQ
jgi:WD40-like Beta Propeller Repeat